MTDSTTQWIVIALLAAALVVVGIVVVRRRERARRAELQHRFGPEYDRAIVEHGSVTCAERELAAREGRVGRLQFRDLTDAERRGFGEAWRTLQSRFVDNPDGAAVEANQLINELMRARGYPTDDFEHQAADLSVDHADVVQHYRAAQALTHAKQEGAAHTEDLRQALVHYRALFSDLLEVQSVPGAPMRQIG